jgi:hypothetical protein
MNMNLAANQLGLAHMRAQFEKIVALAVEAEALRTPEAMTALRAERGDNTYAFLTGKLESIAWTAGLYARGALEAVARMEARNAEESEAA